MKIFVSFAMVEVLEDWRVTNVVPLLKKERRAGELYVSGSEAIGENFFNGIRFTPIWKRMGYLGTVSMVCTQQVVFY